MATMELNNSCHGCEDERDILDFFNDVLPVNMQVHDLKQLRSGVAFFLAARAYLGARVPLPPCPRAQREPEIYGNYETLRAELLKHGFFQALPQNALDAMTKGSMPEVMAFARWMYNTFKDRLMVRDLSKDISLEPTGTIPYPPLIGRGSMFSLAPETAQPTALNVKGLGGKKPPQPLPGPDVKELPKGKTTARKHAMLPLENGPAIRKPIKSKFALGKAVPPELYTRTSPVFGTAASMQQPLEFLRHASATGINVDIALDCGAQPVTGQLQDDWLVKASSAGECSAALLSSPLRAFGLTSTLGAFAEPLGGAAGSSMSSVQDDGLDRGSSMHQASPAAAPTSPSLSSGSGSATCVAARRSFSDSGARAEPFTGFLASQPPPLTAPDSSAARASALEWAHRALCAVDAALDQYSALLGKARVLGQAGCPLDWVALRARAGSIESIAQALIDQTLRTLRDVGDYGVAEQPLLPGKRQGSYPFQEITPQRELGDTMPPASLDGAASGVETEHGTSTAASGVEDKRADCVAEASSALLAARSHEDRLRCLSESAGRINIPVGRGTPSAQGAEFSWAPTSSADMDGKSAAAPGTSTSEGRSHVAPTLWALCSAALLDKQLKSGRSAHCTLRRCITMETHPQAFATRHAQDYVLGRQSNGDVHQEFFTGPMLEGLGVCVHSNGDTYEGEYKGGSMHGYGVFSYSHGGQYEGQMSGGNRGPVGVETSTVGTTYRGCWAGCRNGWGECLFFNGDHCEGSWLNGQLDGRGLQQYWDGELYMGEFRGGLRDGLGLYLFTDGSFYLGEFRADQRDGYGVLTYADGAKYEGQWLGGKQHGHGVCSLSDGKRTGGTWTQGKPFSHDHERNGAAPCAKEAQGVTQAAVKEADKMATAAWQHVLQHFAANGPVQPGLRGALKNAYSSVTAAQAARRAAANLACELDGTAPLQQKQADCAHAAQ